MTYTINQSALTTIAKEKRKRTVSAIVAYLGSAVVLTMSQIDHLFRGASFDVGGAIFLLLWFLLGGIFLFFLPYKRTTFIAKNIINQIDIDGERCIFNFSIGEHQDTAPISFKAGHIEIVPADKTESQVFKGKSFIVFNEGGKKAYFVDEYFDESALILDQLNIKNRGPRYNGFLNWVFNEARPLKNAVLYRIPIINIVLSLSVIITGIKLDISLLGLLLVALLFLAMILPLNLYPQIRKLNLINHLIKRIEVKDNYCYLYCNNVIKNEEYYEVCELREISIGEKEIYHERFFSSEKFMVLNVNERKFYLHGDLLSQYEPLFRNIK